MRTYSVFILIKRKIGWIEPHFIPKAKVDHKLNEMKISEEEREIIKNEIDVIHDEELEKSIVNLGASIKREDNK